LVVFIVVQNFVGIGDVIFKISELQCMRDWLRARPIETAYSRLFNQSIYVAPWFIGACYSAVMPNQREMS